MDLQWPLIVVGLVGAVAVAVWLLSIGMWLLVAAMVAATAHAGYTGLREGLPLLPARRSRARA